MKAQTNIIVNDGGLTIMVRMGGCGITHTFQNTVFTYEDIKRERRQMIRKLIKGMMRV